MTNGSLNGKTALVTGATDGHGKAMAIGLSAHGANVVIHGRNPEKCRAVQREIQESTGRAPGILICDLSSMKDIDRAAQEFINRFERLHILINNAGQVNQKYTETIDGYESTFAVNYLALFKLTLLLFGKLKDSAPSRIINVASDMHRLSSLDPDDLEAKKSGYSMLGSYGRSKLAIVYFTRELSRRIQGCGVSVNAVDPGPVASNIANKRGAAAFIAKAIIGLTFPSPERAARTAMMLAESPEYETSSGGYYRFMKAKEPSIGKDEIDIAKRLWNRTINMCGMEK
jgi:NAD(P)-dependent dehydrogenase (short-subunit alcohol dehydrogenase family)